MPFDRSIDGLKQSSRVACPSRGHDSGVHLPPNNPESLHTFYYYGPKPLREEDIPGTKIINVHADKPCPKAGGVIVYPDYFTNNGGDSATSDCAIGSESSLDSYGTLDTTTTHAPGRSQTDEGLFKKRRCPEKAAGHSMITALLDQERQIEAQPSRGFEHLDPKKITSHTQQPNIQPQPESCFVTYPELEFYCPPRHPIYKKPALEHEKSQRPKGPPEVITVVRPAQKALRMQACIDCTSVPWMTN